MAKRTAPTAFEVCVDAPATPDFVVKTAQLVSAMLEAAGQSSSDPGITMEVFNYDTRVVIHPRSKGGRTAAAKVVRFVADPVAASRRDREDSRLIAQAIFEHRKLLGDRKAQMVVPSAKGNTTTQIDKPFLDSVKGLAEGSNEALMPPLSETEEVTQVLRVGRSSVNAEMTARIMVNCEPYDLPFEPSCKAYLFELAESEALARLRLEVVSNPDRSGHVLPKLSRILEVMPFEEMTGAEFMQGMHALTKDGQTLFNRPIDEIIADLQDRW